MIFPPEAAHSHAVYGVVLVSKKTSARFSGRVLLQFEKDVETPLQLFRYVTTP